MLPGLIWLKIYVPPYCKHDVLAKSKNNISFFTKNSNSLTCSYNAFRYYREPFSACLYVKKHILLAFEALFRHLFSLPQFENFNSCFMKAYSKIGQNLLIVQELSLSLFLPFISLFFLLSFFA